jgi:hypothetical protein
MGFQQRTKFQNIFFSAYQQADNYDECRFLMAGAGLSQIEGKLI